MTYEQIYKVIKLYNQYKGSLNDNGTVASDEQIAEWIVPSVEDAINDEEIDTVEKEQKIEVPQGYEIDRQKSTFEKIVFKKVEPCKPTTWEEYCKQTKNRTYYTYICCCESHVGETAAHGFYGEFSTKERVKQYVALGKLLQLRDYWVKNNKFKEAIGVFTLGNGVIVTNECATNDYALTFPTQEMADKFINCFRDLINKAYPLV